MPGDATEGERPEAIAAMRRNLAVAQRAWHTGCVACGSRNSRGLKLEFSVHDGGQVEALFPCGAVFEGYPDHLHGGIIATLLDSAMTNCLFAHGLVGLTGELKVRYHHPVGTGRAAHVRAWLERSSRRVHAVRAELEQDGEIKAAGTGRFMVTPPASAPRPCEADSGRGGGSERG